MKPRIAALTLALSLAVALPLAACGGSDAPERTGRPTPGQVSTALQNNGGFGKTDADCVSKKVADIPDATLWAIVDKRLDGEPKAAQEQANTVLTAAFSACNIVLRPDASTTIP